MHEAIPLRIEYYAAADGSVPFRDWFLKLSDQRAQQFIRRRLLRLEDGNLGDCKFFDPSSN